VLCGPRALCFLRRPEPSRRCSLPWIPPSELAGFLEPGDLQRLIGSSTLLRSVNGTAPQSTTPVPAWSENGVGVPPSEHHSGAAADRLRPVFGPSSPRSSPPPAMAFACDFNAQIAVVCRGRGRRPQRRAATKFVPHGGDGEQETLVEPVRPTRHHW
jgi:hypothetical protein